MDFLAIRTCALCGIPTVFRQPQPSVSMGRLPPPITGGSVRSGRGGSGGVIFYSELKSARNLAERDIQDEGVKTSAQESKKKATRRSSSIGIASPIALSDDQPETTSVAPQTNPFPLSISATQDFPDAPLPCSIIRPDSPSNLRHHAAAGAQILLPLLKDACDLFHQVPYVKIITGLVQEIIKISEEVDAINENITQLIGKIINFSQVVFEELMACHKAGYYSQELSNIQDDLLELETVIRSGHSTLQLLTAQGGRSLFSRIVFRADINSRIAKEDKKLDDTITAFQIKSASRIRINVDKISVGMQVYIYQTVCRFKAWDLWPSTEQALRFAVPPVHATSTHPQRRIAPRGKPQIFFGRSREVDTIVDVLVQGIHDIDGLPPRICILGVGGIGKTTLAVSILHHERVAAKFCEGRYFLPCDAITSADLLLAELAAVLDMDEGPPVNSQKSVHHKLKQVPCLLVLDNFETPWEYPHTRSEIESLLTGITSIETVSLIITMRGSQMPSGTRWSKILPPLQPVDADSAVAIFKAITQREADKYALKLIQAMDCIPLAITLVANLTSVEGETTENLWIRWQEERTSMVGNGSDRLTNLEKSIQLTLSGPRMQQDPSALRFLGAICLLPHGMSSETLRECISLFPGMYSIRKAISTLRQNALVYEDPNKYLRVLSPIRLFVLLRHPPSLKARQFIHRIFMKLALKAPSIENVDVRSHIHMEVANINAMLIDALQNSSGQYLNDVSRSILNFCQYTYISGIASTHAISSAVEKLEQQQEMRQLGSAIHPPTRQKPLWSKKFQILEFSTFKSRKSVKMVIADKHTQTPVDATLKLLADCFGCWGQILSQQSQFDLAKEKYDRANALHTKSKDVVGQAYDMLNIGLLLSRDFKNADEALQIFQESVELHEKGGDMRGKAYGLMAAGSVLNHIFKFEDAKANFTSAVAILATMDMDSGSALALHGLGEIMLSLSRFEEAEKYFQDATKLNISSGHIVGQAENLAGLSFALLMRSQVSEAQRVIESAIALQQPASEGDRLFVLGRISMARASFEQAEIILSRALSLHEATEDISGQAYDLLFLANVAFLRGNSKSARDLMSQASSTNYQHKMFQAEFMMVRAQIPDPAIKPEERAEWLETASTFFSKIGSVLEQAQCLHFHGVHHLSLSELALAMEKLEHALKLHVEVGNIQGQADDLNKIAEVLLLKGSLTESSACISKALVLHTQIEDFTGQGNDLYIQSAILLAKDQFVDADVTIRKAIKLHEIVKSKYGLARDFSILGTIVWRQSRVADRKVTGAHGEQDAFTWLAQAMQLFAELEASREYDECEERRNIMQKDIDKLAAQQC